MSKYTIHEILFRIISSTLLIVAWTAMILLVAHISVQLVVWLV